MVSNFQQDFISDEIFLYESIIHVPYFLCYVPLFHVQPGFDWGQVDTNALAKCLLTLCRELKDTLCLEPRLVKLKSPVYILGKKFVIYIIKYNVHGFFVLFYNYTCKQKNRNYCCVTYCKNTCTCIWTGFYKDRFIVSEFKLNLHGNDQRHEHIAIIITIFLQSALKRKQLCTINLYICTPTVCPTSRITCTGTCICFGHELILNLIILFFMVHVQYVKHVQ